VKALLLGLAQLCHSFLDHQVLSSHSDPSLDLRCNHPAGLKLTNPDTLGWLQVILIKSFRSGDYPAEHISSGRTPQP
jgi:hypothetical protein